MLAVSCASKTRKVTLARMFTTWLAGSPVAIIVGCQLAIGYASGAAPSLSTYRYVYASYIDEPVLRFTTSGSTSHYYHRNQQYSIYAITNSSAGIVERYAYTAYGAPTISNSSGTPIGSTAISNRLTYTGREWDAVTFLFHFRARLFDPALGRFLSRDPKSYDGSPFNLSEFLGGHVTTYLDPMGEAWVRIAVVVVTACGKFIHYIWRKIKPIKPTPPPSGPPHTWPLQPGVTPITPRPPGIGPRPGPNMPKPGKPPQTGGGRKPTKEEIDEWIRQNKPRFRD